MKLKTSVQSLIRSPLRTLITLLLLGAAAFLFLYNLSEYSVSDREYREARDKYEGVLTVEVGSVSANADPGCFRLVDGTAMESGGSENQEILYRTSLRESLGEDLIGKLAALPHISRVERRYLTAGVSPQYYRLDTDKSFYDYSARCIFTATVKEHFQDSVHDAAVWPSYKAIWKGVESIEYLILEDAELLAGDPSCLWDIIQKKNAGIHAVYVQVNKEELREDYASPDGFTIRFGGKRRDVDASINLVFPEDAAIPQPGRRCLLVLRDREADLPVFPVETFKDHDVYNDHFYDGYEVGDDSLLGWWPYFTDITDLPENWLEGEEFSDLRELIRVTNDDVHTFDVVYGDDMAAQRRVSENRLICEEGRFITPADAGQPVCVVSTDFLEMSGLSVGDSITLNLGNYLSEQYAPLGAVACTRERQNTEYSEQTFTIIGSWRDLNEGKHIYQDLFWCWSNNAVFVPTAFLPDCRNAEGHEFKPGEVSFIVGNAEEISAFVEECLPQVEAMGLTYEFSDGGWLQIGEGLMQSRRLALVKLLIFSGAALFALILTVWLFIGRKKREYGILRALGMPKGEAGNRLYIPFLILGLVSAVLGLAAARIVTVRQLMAEAAHAPAAFGLFLLGGLGFLALLALLAFVGLLLVRKRSILELVQEKQK